MTKLPEFECETAAARTPRTPALHRLIAMVTCGAVFTATMPPPVLAQQTSPPYAESANPPADAQPYPPEQLNAILAPIALYPDELLTQVLMASAYPVQIVEAARWVQDPANRSLTGDMLTQALAPQPWDPSVKSLVPFPQVLDLMNTHLDWTQQLGYAMAVQEGAVMEAVQHLRHQAQIAGQLRSSEQQIVRSDGETIVIAPAQPSVVYVPVYNPTVVYGPWSYPSYPPVYLPPPPGYYAGPGLVAGLAFGAGIAITAGLWGWARPNWGGRNVNINVNHYNMINVNRPPISDSHWRPTGPVSRPGGGGTWRPAGAPGGGFRPPAVQAPAGGGFRPGAGAAAPGGFRRPVGAPPAGGFNRPNPPGAVSPNPGVRPLPGGPANRPGGPAPGFNRPTGAVTPPPGNRPAGPVAANRPAFTPPAPNPAAARPSAVSRPVAPAPAPRPAPPVQNFSRPAPQPAARPAPQAASRPASGGGGERSHKPNEH